MMLAYVGCGLLEFCDVCFVLHLLASLMKSHVIWSPSWINSANGVGSQPPWSQMIQTVPQGSNILTSCPLLGNMKDSILFGFYAFQNACISSLGEAGTKTYLKPMVKVTAKSATAKWPPDPGALIYRWFWSMWDRSALQPFPIYKHRKHRKTFGPSCSLLSTTLTSLTQAWSAQFPAFLI